ncbi:enoyl-CoA hydratase-related protein [Streptomyces antimycoticus]|uniref:enoyl-CoA hydratase-related protein n=1 Tax=Streptomyces antimycoticus TaxID=68175 RepID=UPI0034375044
MFDGVVASLTSDRYGGATALVPAAVGLVRAARMAMLAERIPAALAAEWGLVAFCEPDDTYASRVEEITARLASGPTAAHARTKEAFNATALAGPDAALARERGGSSRCSAPRTSPRGARRSRPSGSRTSPAGERSGEPVPRR